MADEPLTDGLKGDILSANRVVEVLSGDEVGRVKIEGISIAGQETCIILPQFDVVFDTGRCPQRSVFQRHVLISHAHLDHIGGLAHHICTRDMQGLKPPIVFMPKVIANGTRAILDAYQALDGCDYHCTILPCEVGQSLPISFFVTVHPFETAHVIPSLGYVLTRTKKKLKQHLLGLPGPEIKRLKDAGEEIQDSHTVAEVAFTGDTTIDFLKGTSEATRLALTARLLIMELTFLDDSITVEKARKRGHTHINEFIENANCFRDNERILLIHVSARYGRTLALKLLNEKLPASLKSKCSVLLEGFKSS